MNIYFDIKNQAIEYLSIEALEINTMGKLTEYRARGEKLVLLLKGEINNNANIDSPAYLKYLKNLKAELWSFFAHESFIDMSEKSAEYNIVSYHNNSDKYAYKNSLDEYATILKTFKSTITNDAKKSFKKLLKEDKEKYRKLGELPYTKFPRTQIIKLISVIANQGYAEHFHGAVLHRNDPNDLNHAAIRSFYFRFLMLNTEEYKTQFLWEVIGYLLAKIQTIESETRGIDYYFKDLEDLKRVRVLLRSNGVIDDENQWAGAIIKAPGTKLETRDGTKTAVLALIECLDDRRYLQKYPDKTTIGRAFCKSFDLSLSDRALRNNPTLHQEYLTYFKSIIPDR